MLTLVVAAAAAVADSKKFEWLSEDVDGGAVPAATGAPLDMALDSHHQPHIFYSAAFELPHTYHYATRDAATGNWTVETVDTFGFKYGTFSAQTHIVMDKNDRPHVLYTMEGTGPSPCPGCSSCVSCSGPPPPCCNQPDNSCCDPSMWGSLFYATKVDGVWKPTLVHKGWRLNMSDARPMDCSLALDESGNPHISYYLERPKMTLVYATRTSVTADWTMQEVASGGYGNAIELVGTTPLIVYQNEDDCFCAKLWALLPNGTQLTATVAEGPNDGVAAQGYGIATTVSPDHTRLYVTFTRNVYTNGSLRMVEVPLGTGGVPTSVPTVSQAIGTAGRASQTSVTVLPSGEPIVAFSFGTADQSPFEVRSTQQGAPALKGWLPSTVGSTAIANGGLDGPSAVGIACCDALGRPVMAFSRRTSMYVSYLSFAWQNFSSNS